MDKPVKVLAVVCQMNRGGLECRMMDILRFIDRTKVQIDLFTYRENKGYFDDEAISLGSTIYYNKPLTVRNMHAYSGYFADFLRKHPEYKIVHAHQDAWCSVFCKGAYMAGVPVRIAHSRTSIETFTVPNLVKNIIKLPTVKYATHYFAVSAKAGKWLFGKKNMEKGLVKIWPNAIDTHPFQYNEEVRKMMQKEFKLSGETVILHVGNFTPPKNQMFLLDIFAAYVKKNPHAVLLMAGKGEHTVHQEKAEHLGIAEKVYFLGGRDDIEKILQVGDVFVFPSLFEGFPGAVLEAQAAGLPCLISDSITEEVCILPTTRRLSLKDSTEMWSEAIEQALQMKRIDQIPVIEQAGYDIRRMVVELENFYTESIKEVY